MPTVTACMTLGQCRRMDPWYYEIPDQDVVTDHLGPETGEFQVIKERQLDARNHHKLRLSFRDYGIEGREDLGFRIARYAGSKVYGQYRYDFYCHCAQ